MSMFEFMLMDQKIPNKEKTEEWHKQHAFSMIDAVIGHRGSTLRKEQQLNLWKKTLCISNKIKQSNELVKSDAITKPYGLSLGIEWMDYPLIESMIEQLVGEYLAQEIKKKTYTINKRGQSKKLDHMFDMIAEDIMRDFSKEVEPELGFAPETQNKDMQLPENIEEFISSEYKTEAEEVSDMILTMVLEAKKNKNILKDLFFAFLVQDDVIADVVEEYGNPAIKHLSTFETIYDWDPAKEIQTNPQYIAFAPFMAFNEIINKFDLTDDEETMLKSYASYQSDENIPGLNSVTVGGEGGFDSPNDYGKWFRQSGGVLQVRILEMRWMSKKQIRVKVSKNPKTGKDIYKLLNDDYKQKEGDTIDKIWVDEKRHIIMVGPNLILEYGVMPERYSLVSNIKADRFLTIGLRRNGNLGMDVIRSAAAKLEQLQDFAGEILFEIRLAARRNPGKVMVYDAAQTPKHFMKGTGSGAYENALNRVMHHMKKDQVLMINSQDKNSRYQFNQFTALDLSNKGALAEMFNMLMLIEDVASKFIGISPQRAGQVGQYETQGGTERAVAQSTARSEIFTNPFESFLQEIMECIVLMGKNVYEEGETIQHIFGDNKAKFFKIMPSFFQDDIGVYIGDTVKDRKRKAVIDRAAEQAFTNAQTPELILTLTQVLNADFATEAEKILKRGMAAMEKSQKENMEAEAQNAKVAAESAEKIADEERKVKRDGFAKDIKVAQIQANAKTISEDKKADTVKKVKAADIEKDFILADKNQQSKEKV